ncbi:MAG: SBBP repeat-containing protein [Promethearchaeota archaeon]
MRSKLKSSIFVFLIFSLLIFQQHLSNRGVFERVSPDILPDSSDSQHLICELNITWGGDDIEYAEYLAKDSAGNIYLAGLTNNDVILVKLDVNYIPQWNITWGGPNRDMCFGLAIDSNNNIYLTGETESFGAGERDMFLLKYDSSGYQHWNRTWGGTDRDRCSALAIDSSNNIYVTGLSDSLGRVNVLVKYNSLGTEIWTRSYIGGDFRANAIIIDLMDNIFLAGNYWTTNWEIGLVKYDISGNQLWTRTWGGNDYDEAHGIAIDYSGIYIVARTRTSPSEEFDLFVLKCDRAGNQLWNSTWGEDGWEYSEVIETDISGNVYVLGATNSAGARGFLVKFDPFGRERWNFTWSDRGYSDMILEFEDNFYFSGSLMGDMLLSKYRYGYFNILNVEIEEQIFCEAVFNISFYIYSILEGIGGFSILGIDTAKIQMWWNGINISNDVQNLGSGYYFVSLEPITVAPGEDPILLNMTISATNYADKYFEIDIAVDPASLLKGEGEPTEEFPLILIIIISVLCVGAIVGLVSLFLLRRRKREPQ